MRHSVRTSDSFDERICSPIDSQEPFGVPPSATVLFHHQNVSNCTQAARQLFREFVHGKLADVHT
ncbi:hypothetical protein ASG73_05330 [Janibacter sp. Soil728]|nr:hypothetical protein ASG73_05330 [Janibacter sp. Soil728]